LKEIFIEMSKKLFFSLLDEIVSSMCGTGKTICGIVPSTCKLVAPKPKKMEAKKDSEQRELPKVPDTPPPPPAPGDR